MNSYEGIIDKARQAGVRRGINASITRLERLRDLHSETSAEWRNLTKAILELETLTIEQAEEI